MCSVWRDALADRVPVGSNYQQHVSPFAASDCMADSAENLVINTDCRLC